MSRHPLFEEIRNHASIRLQFALFLAATLTATLLLPAQLSAKVVFSSTSIAGADANSSVPLSGDFNNDGILDMVTVNNSTVSFYEGLGNGNFAAPVQTTFSGTLGNRGFAVADLNGDGKLDIAFATNGGVTILLGNGDGTFTLGAPVSVPGGSCSGMVLADFNGDHIPDMAFASCPPEQSCAILVYLGQGNGTFQQSATLNVYGVNAIEVGDFNADGYQDIAVAEYNSVDVFLGEGNGRFQNPISTSQPYPTDLVAGDFYDDRIQTLAVENTVDEKQGGQKVYINTIQYSNGELLSTNPQFVAGSTGLIGFGIEHGDLNGDFKDDLALGGSYSTSQSSTGTPLNGYMLGTGKGTFDSMVTLPTQGDYDGVGFVRDLNLDSRHDIGLGWGVNYPNPGGVLVLLNENAAPNCDPPRANALGVNICTPTEGETIGTTFTFKGAGNAFNGIAKRMELWIDGTKVGQNLEDQLKVSATLTAGTHTAAFVVVDSFDNYTSKSVSFTVK